MAFSASALRFTLQGLMKPVIFTRSQFPIGTIRKDGKANLNTAIKITVYDNKQGQSIFQGVEVYFEYP